MASTLTIQSTSYGGRYLQLDCTQTKDVATNTSTIRWTLTSTGGSAKYYTTGPTTVTIGGTQVYYIERKGYTTEVFPAAKGSVSGTTSIKHNDNGGKSISVSLSTAIYTSTVRTYSKNWELDSIPRGATLTSAPNFTDADNPTIYYSNPAGAAVTSLQACISFTGSLDDVKYRDVPKTGASSYTFPLTEAERTLLRNNTTGPSRTVYFCVRTIIGGVTYYHTVPCTLTIKESAATKPYVSMYVTLNNSSLPSKFNGIYIQGKSRVNVTLAAYGQYNASITSRYAVIGGQTYNSDSFTSSVIQSSGKVDLIGYAKDSRGFTNSDTKSIDVIAYSKPLVIPLNSENAILCYRSDGNGKRVSNSTSLWVKAQKSYYTITSGGEQKNFCALEYRYKLSSEAWSESRHPWKELISKSNTATNEYNALIPSEVFDTKKSYTVQIRAIDDIGEYDSKTFDIPTEDVTMHLRKGGKGVAIGKYAELENYFEVDYDAQFNKAINGTFIKSKYITTNTVTIQSRFSSLNAEGNNRQSIFIFGTANGFYTYGIIAIHDNGVVSYVGNRTDITCSCDKETGKITIDFPAEYPLWDCMTFISAYDFTIE